MLPRLSLLSVCSVALVAAMICDVHAPRAIAQGAKGKSVTEPRNDASKLKPGPVAYGTEKLPAPVIDMREAILAAVRSGEIEDLRPAIQMNELRPDFGAGNEDPITTLTRTSADGRGREMLARLANLLDAGYTTLPLGRDAENNRLYVWPYHAEMSLDTLTPAQHVELLQIVPAADVQAMLTGKRYTSWRLVIGADGVWHSFTRQQ